MRRFTVPSHELNSLIGECKAEEANDSVLAKRSTDELIDDHLRRREQATTDKRKIRAQANRETRAIMRNRA